MRDRFTEKIYEGERKKECVKETECVCWREISRICEIAREREREIEMK